MFFIFRFFSILIEVFDLDIGNKRDVIGLLKKKY